MMALATSLGGTASVRAFPAMAKRILVADDQSDVCIALGLLLKGAGYQIETAGSPRDVLAAVSGRAFDLLLMDLNYARDTTSGREGLDLLAQLRAQDPGLPVVVMTAWGSIELAVEAMRRGASDFVLKPWDNASLVRTVAGNAVRRLVAPAAPAPTAPDLKIAQRVQSRLFPQRLPELETLECAALCLEVEAVGGDAYDFLDLGPGRMGLVLADASGKGVAGALLMAHLQACLRSQSGLGSADLP